MPSSSSSSSPMDAVAAAKKMSRGGGKKEQRQSGSSFWGAMALKNRSQPEGGESKESSNKGKTTTRTRSLSIGRSMTCAGSICGTKESAVLSRGSGRGSGGGGRDGNRSSSRSLKAPDNDNLSVSVSMAASSAVVSASSSFNSETTVATTATTVSSSSSSSPLSSVGAGSRSFRKLSGCYYECHSVLDPKTSSHVGGGAAMAMLPCADCDEFFVKAESLELHRSTRHAVSELGADDTSRNVVEIIFQSSWLVRKPRTAAPVPRIERILKVHSSGRTVERFEQYRERVKAGAAASSADELARRSYPRCAADGNELLRFHCTTFNACSLGLGATALCRSPSTCKLCSIIRDGFRLDGDGKIATTATSGRAHDTARVSLSDGGGSEKRAMLVCRVVAGRVKKVVNGSNSSEQFGSDSVSSDSDLDELFVFSSRAILPCFVVIYTVATDT